MAPNIPTSDNRALSKLIFGGDSWKSPLDGWTTPEPATLEVGMTEADFSNKGLQAAGAIIVAAWLSHKDKGGISSVNLIKNDIGVDQAKDLVSILKEHPTLKSLCGNKGDETKLDMSGKMNGAGDAILLAAEIVDNGPLSVLNLMNSGLTRGVLKAYPGQYVVKNEGCREEAEWGTNGSDFDTDMSGIISLVNAIPDMRAMTKLDVSTNDIRAAGTKLLAEALTGNSVMTELNISANSMTRAGNKFGDMSGIAVLADVISGMGAMMSLNLASNRLGVEGAKIIAAILPNCT
jgi:hypothetical protein